jgi:hypothetical protein
MRIHLLLVTALALSAAFADTLTLRNGQTVEGQYLGGTARQVRMAVGDSVQTFDVSDVASLRFEGGPSQAAVAPAAPAAPMAPAAPAPSMAAEQPRVLQPEPEPAPAPSPAGVDELPAGTAVTVRMVDSVDSKVAQVGQTFRATVDDPVVVNGETVIPRGADVVTKLVELKESGKIAGGGQLTLDLASISVDGRMVDVSAQSVTTAGQSRKGESAKVIGGTAALGAIIGAIAGGGKGAAIGAIAGGGAGTAVQVLTKGPEVRIPSETRLTFTLQRPVRL